METETGLKLKKKLEVYSPIATEVHVLVTCIENNGMMRHCNNFTDLTEKAVGVDTANITNRAIIFLFIKSLYNKDIRRRVAGAKPSTH